MSRFLKVATTATALALSFGAAQAGEPLGDVIVESRTAGIEGNAQYTFFPNIVEDLETTIESMVVHTGLDTDSMIEINIIELLLDGNVVDADGDQFNQMRLTVEYSHPESVFNAVIFPVLITATEVEAVPTAGFIVRDATAPDFYKVLIRGAAEEVIDNIPEEIDAPRQS